MTSPLGEILSAVLWEALFYFAIGGMVFAVLFGLLAAGMLAELPRWGWAGYVRHLRRAALFAGLLFIWGAAGNALWLAVAAGRLYKRADPLIDFLPVVPFGGWVIDEVCGGHLMPGVSYGQLRLLWLAVAGAVWSLAILSYRSLPRVRKA